MKERDRLFKQYCKENNPPWKLTNTMSLKTFEMLSHETIKQSKMKYFENFFPETFRYY